MTDRMFSSVVVVLLVAIGVLLWLTARPVSASAPSGLPATIATTSNPIVNTSAAIIFATSSCAARIITTASSSIMLTFADQQGQTPTGSFGHLQGASTTVAYDSGLYGCGLVKAYSFASQVITVSESR